MMKANSLLVSLAGAFLLTANGARAYDWKNPTTWPLFRSNRIDTVLVAGNYAKPRLLAELAQKRTGQPILLISPLATGGDQLFILPACNEGLAEDSAKFAERIEMLNPKQVIFLGDSDFMPVEYVEQLRNRVPILTVIGDNWVKNAETLGNALHTRGLAKRYAKLLAVLEEATANRPLGTAAMATSAAQAPAEEEMPDLSAAPPKQSRLCPIVPEPAAVPRLAPPAKR